MSAPRWSTFNQQSDDARVSEQILADLERKAEQGISSGFGSCDSGIDKEHHRYFSLIEKLVLPIRTSIRESSTPPSLPGYGALEEIGRGGMGIVYSAQHLRMQRIDAIKVIRPDRLVAATPADAQQLRYRFLRESRLAARVSHQHIVSVFQVRETDEPLWFSMQYVDGSSLHELSHQKALTFEDAVKIVERISRAVAVVHRHGVLHGDIKPHNILVESETNRPLITDFGLAELVHGGNRFCDAVAGTFAYMAPELVLASLENRSPEEVAATRSVSSDVYSLGATLSAALHNSVRISKSFDIKTVRPSTSQEVSAAMLGKREGVPTELARICRKSMSIDSGSRYATADEFADDLLLWLERPAWNRHFPNLGKLLLIVVAPGLGFSGLAVWLLLQRIVPEWVIWLAIFVGYIPLFLAFLIGQTYDRAAHRATRELWSVWLGHLVGSVACMIALRIGSSNIHSTVAMYYPCCAAISAVAFFAKSGNFWKVYRPIGFLWAIAAVVLSMIPAHNALIFGGLAAVTCMLIARGDEAFAKR